MIIFGEIDNSPGVKEKSKRDAGNDYAMTPIFWGNFGEDNSMLLMLYPHPTNNNREYLLINWIFRYRTVLDIFKYDHSFFPSLDLVQVSAIVLFMLSSPSSYIFFIRFMIPA